MEMGDYYDSRSEVWQESDKGVVFAERQEEFEAVLSQLEALTI